ncbi:hypothetical protein N752_01575 [Desulforamulus aquiferis]|nr:hypothetical protein [Desulforamulus aquiferis]RYD06843.1 hypothetical protein N752_01575 [Desulforamulus aquiferis]
MKIYVVNTNRTNSYDDDSDMIGHQKCAAYYDPWKYKIDDIKANDLVFLYRNGVGIIARGIATGIVEISDYNGDKDEEHYMNLNNFEYLRKPLPASLIKTITGIDHVFSQTMFSINYDQGINVWRHITRNCL